MNRFTRRLINFFTLLTVLLQHQSKAPVASEPIPVYMLTNHQHAYLAILSILSLDRHIRGLQFIIIDHNELSRFDKWLLQRVPVKSITIIDSSKQFKWLKKYPYNWAYYTQVWSGIKFFTTLFYQRSVKKCIVMDSDTLFIRKPERVIKWIQNASDKKTLHLLDYMNFSVISPFEAEYQVGVKVSTEKLNSGFVCLNLEELHQKNSLSDINLYIKKITAIMKSRMTRDSYGREELERSMYIIEQTLFQLVFSHMNHEILPPKYSLLTAKVFRDSVFVHFTPDGSEKILFYRYLLFSLKKWLTIIILRKGDRSLPWFCAASFSDFSKVHLSKQRFRTGTKFFLHDLELNITD